MKEVEGTAREGMGQPGTGWHRYTFRDRSRVRSVKEREDGPPVLGEIRGAMGAWWHRVPCPHYRPPLNAEAGRTSVRCTKVLQRLSAHWEGRQTSHNAVSKSHSVAIITGDPAPSPHMSLLFRLPHPSE